MAWHTGKNADAASFVLIDVQRPTQNVESVRPLQHLSTAP